MENKNSNIAIVCSTYYPSWYQGPLRSIHHTDKIRGDLALELIEKALRNNYWVVVSDGFSTKTFQKKLNSLSQGKLILIKRKNKHAKSYARRQAFYRAMKIEGVRVIVYTEPEKIGIIEYIPDISKPILDHEADIVIPQREEKLFRSSYPSYQYESEIEGNLLYNRYLQLHKITKETECDFFFGPRAYKADKRVKALFHHKYKLKIGKHTVEDELINPEDLSDYLFFPIVLALKRNLLVKSVTVPFKYPLLQKQNEEVGQRKYFEEKRRSQRLSLVLELMQFLSYLERKKK